ncbi:TetR/AcrR family transcriptional regulator [Gordonia paraffinivorans]|uniref:TetR/AcrR family transcriptional regulator n=1 Tax=Gordonia paraffinivorans TaxID=175628 RepID=UPI0014450412|nr:TetR/AcrR family transcriptional regulator [Gordonia paraffinivorans]
MASANGTAIDPREQVIRAADELFNAHGVRAVGMDRVRDAAGVSLKKIYSLFPSKEALILAVLEGRSRQWNDGIAAAAEGATGPRDKLLAIFDFLLHWFGTDEYRGCVFINAYGELGAESPAVAEAVRRQKADFQEYVAGLVAELGGPRHLAAQLAILAEGAQTTAAISGGVQAAVDARSAAEILIDHALAS